MSYDTYQPIYDAVRSKISGGDIGTAVENAMNNANLSFYIDRAAMTIQEVANEYLRPSVQYRPKLFPDGSVWCALYGEDLHSGVAGFGKSPDDAMRAFDAAFYAAMPERTAPPVPSAEN